MFCIAAWVLDCRACWILGRGLDGGEGLEHALFELALPVADQPPLGERDEFGRGDRFEGLGEVG